MKSFFTIPDPDLTQESSVDPMGLQAIWTYYGQAIFNQKITTIANDLRVFTFNLFHQHLLNELYTEHTEALLEAKTYYKSWKTEYDVKAGLLMFIEDLVTWTFYLQQESSETDVEKLGILGLNKARRAHSTITEDSIYLEANKSSGLLKNQINLGMTGRYKGPMMNMVFFDRSLSLLPKTWEHFNRLMRKWTEAIALEKHVIKLIVKQLFESPRKDYPRLSLQEVKSSGLWKPISHGYLSCFGRRKLPNDIRNFWQDKLGLNTGAPKAVFEQLGKEIQKGGWDHATVLRKAKSSLKTEPGELEKVEQIIQVEPFLSHSEYLLRYIAQPSVKKMIDIEDDLMQLRESIKRAANFSITDSVARLKELQVVMISDGSLEMWLHNVLDYHSKIMGLRGGTMWVNLDEKGNFKHFFGGTLHSNLDTTDKYLQSGHWYHTYYLETLASIYDGLN